MRRLGCPAPIFCMADKQTDTHIPLQNRDIYDSHSCDSINPRPSLLIYQTASAIFMEGPCVNTHTHTPPSAKV